MTSPVKFDRCAACHVNVHRESVKEDCKSCHTETTFKGAAFDHGARTSFALDGKHAGLMCRACHTTVSTSDVPLARKVVDYSGARRECVACHADKDPHKGEFGWNCESCHRPSTFAAKDFKHPRAPDFYAGNHETVACVKCHVPAATASVKPAAPSMDCATCHKDVHLGQLGVSCETCHAVSGTKFAAVNFAHERTTFALTGKHGAVACAACHKTETRRFPSSTGAAIVFKPVETTCQSCHKDPHLGQVKAQCDTCHATATFDMPAFKHEGMDDFFSGFHGRYACVACHKKETGQFPAGQGTAVRLSVGRSCAACHKAF